MSGIIQRFIMMALASVALASSAMAGTGPAKIRMTAIIDSIHNANQTPPGLADIAIGDSVVLDFVITQFFASSSTGSFSIDFASLEIGDVYESTVIAPENSVFRLFDDRDISTEGDPFLVDWAEGRIRGFDDFFEIEFGGAGPSDSFSGVSLPPDFSWMFDGAVGLVMNSKSSGGVSFSTEVLSVEYLPGPSGLLLFALAGMGRRRRGV